MAKMRVTRLGVLSFAKMQGLIGVVLGFLIGVPYGLIFMFLGAAMLSARSSDATAGGAGGFIAGILIMIGAPILYGIFSFVAGAIGALIYNGAAKLVGGLEMELDNIEPYYGAQHQAPPPQQNWAPKAY
jgi:hypothetical protein